jgi:hypothetical protein
MRKSILCSAALVAALGACAQKNPTAVKYAKYITIENARKHLTVIAADDMEGRETSKPGADKAANYLAAEYRKLGLLPANKGSYFLNVPLTSTAFKVKSFTVNGKALAMHQKMS